MISATGTRNDVAWEQLFEKYSILAHVGRDGQFPISAKQINEFREARLMTKFDDIEHLPSLFRENRLSILPTSRGDYVIAKVEAYKRLEPGSLKPVEFLDPPKHIESLDYENITSEATAINCAYISGILNHFLGESELWLTVSGRMSSGAFDFVINSTSNRFSPMCINVNNAQIEIDGGFEGHDSLSLIEAKNAIPYSFLIRQLYYPYRLWQNRVTKKVRPLFLTYANRIFHLYEYRFKEVEDYSAITLVRDQRYSLETNDIFVDDIRNLLVSTPIIEEPELPFPQADSFERVINICELLQRSGKLSQDDITATYNFVGRQTHYYTSAGMYLGLIEKESGHPVKYAVSSRGKGLFRKTYRERQLGFVEAIVEHLVFSQGVEHYLQKAELPSPDEISLLMQAANLRNIDSASTYRRRAQTVRRWLEWVVRLQNFS